MSSDLKKRIDARYISKPQLAKSNASLSEMATTAYDAAKAFELQRDIARGQRWLALVIGASVGVIAGIVIGKMGWF